jgi:DNA-binding transcriptional MerR regulator
VARSSTLSDIQIRQIYELKDRKFSIRQIVTETGFTKSQIETALSKRPDNESQQKVATLLMSPVVEATQKSVFDVMARLEESLTLIEGLQDEPGRLDHRVAVLSERRQLIAEARTTLESIYNIRVLNDFIAEVVAILESETAAS